MSRIYQTLAQPAQCDYEEKRSRFLCRIYPVTKKSVGFDYLDALKQDYPDARHHCWAYLLGDPEQALSAGFNDDGEPSGTAGKPMLNVLSQRKAGDVFAVVVRYFGGVKLGAGGLVRAYTQAVSGALDNAKWLEVVPHVSVSVRTAYALEPRIRQLLKAEYAIDTIEVCYQEELHLSFQAPLAHTTTLKRALVNLCGGKMRWQQDNVAD